MRVEGEGEGAWSPAYSVGGSRPERISMMVNSFTAPVVLRGQTRYPSSFKILRKATSSVPHRTPARENNYHLVVHGS